MKKTIIHLLGGVTKDEARKEYTNGCFYAFDKCQKYAESLFPTNADNWCEKMYGFVSKMKTMYENAV